jgi:hypothetical protein
MCESFEAYVGRLKRRSEELVQKLVTVQHKVKSGAIAWFGLFPEDGPNAPVILATIKPLWPLV